MQQKGFDVEEQARNVGRGRKDPFRKEVKLFFVHDDDELTAKVCVLMLTREMMTMVMMVTRVTMTMMVMTMVVMVKRATVLVMVTRATMMMNLRLGSAG